MNASPWQFENHMPPGREFEIHHTTNTNPQPSIFHGHGFYEIYFLLSGSLNVIVESQDITPVLGEVLIYPPQCMHRVTHTDSSQPYERFYIYLSKEYLSAASTADYRLADHLDALTAGGRCRFSLGKQAVLSLVPMADEIITASSDISPAGVLANRCRMTLYLIKLLRLLEKSVDVQNNGCPTPMNSLLHYINQNAAKPLSLDHLEEVFSQSKYILLHEFKDYTGVSVYHYILTRRINLAQQLIEQGVKPSQACQQCGFADYTSFYRAFKARTGLSPTQYSKQKECFRR